MSTKTGMMLQKISELINSSHSILIASHSSPDGDAISSTLALYNALKKIGKEVVAYNRDEVPGDLRFLPGSDALIRELPAGRSFDLGLVLDAGELRRAGTELRDRCARLVNIDHHPHSESFGEINYVDVKASATGILIYRLLNELGYAIDYPVALCIYTAILSDTGSFRYSNADPESFEVAGKLVAMGVDPWKVASGLYESQEEVSLKLLGLALQTLEVSPCGRFAALTVTGEMLAATGATAEHTDRFINYPRSIEGVEVAVFFRQVDAGQFKVGFRSKGHVDVGALAREFGGGGHHNAAGALLKGTAAAIRRQVFERLGELLPNQ
ncbi:DHH family phosphoesterase [Geothermobacter hydrogeniphilus]|nr:bifunctional oligoribonuclease/PAP phosphatase NrnA [Geothermobacter hydrogeniphilus]